MQVKMSKSFRINAPVNRVWEFLSDIEKVTTCMPGAEFKEPLGENRHAVTISIKVGPIKSTYRGEVTVEDLDPEKHHLRLKGKGEDVKGKGGATMEMVGSLKSLDGGATEVTGDSTITISGLMAQFGSRMVEDVSNLMFEQFTTSLRSKLEGTAESEAEVAKEESKPVAGLSLAGTALKGVLSRTIQIAKEKLGLSREDPSASA